MDKNLIWQYIIVVILIVAAIIRMIYSLRRRVKKKSGSCCGCSLASTCHDYRKPKSYDKPSAHNRSCNTQK